MATSTLCAQDAAKSEPQVDKLASQTLHHSVTLLRHTADKPIARAARMVALAKFAQRMAPDDPDINNTVAYISLVRKKSEQFAAAIDKSFAARPGDHALALQWLAAKIKPLQDAQSRSAFLSSVVADEKRTDALRAAAAVHLADICIGQGFRPEAGKAFDTAVKLDPHLPAALAGRLTLADKASPADQAKIWASELAINPHSIGSAVQLGAMFDSAGLYKQGARFYDLAWSTGNRLGLSRKAGLDFAIQHCNALLNAGKHQEATKIMGPISRRFSDSVLLRVLLIEACNNSAQTQRAKIYAGEIEAIFAPKIVGGNPDASAAAELAWLYLITGADIQQALDYARRASVLKPGAPDTVRAMAAAQLLSGRPSILEAGRASLQKIADKDVFAAVFLAEYYLRVSRPKDAEKLVLSGLAISRSGQAARRLNALAAKLKIDVPPTEGAKELAAVAKGIDDSVEAIALAPEKFLTLKAICPKQVDAGDGIVIQAELSSTHDGPLAVGLGGIVPTTVSLDVTVTGRQGHKFTDCVRLLLPAGRYLTGGSKVSVSGRIDVGKFGAFLVAHPLDDLELTVSPRLVDPGAETLGPHQTPPPSLVTVESGKIARTSILGKFNKSTTDVWRSTYKHCLSLIMGDLKSGDLRVRMRGANQIASLLVVSDGLKSQKIKAPAQLSGQIDRRVLTLMVSEALKNPSDIVRAEMLTALGRAKLDPPLIGSLASVIADKSPLVRFRLVELLGASGQKGQEPIINHFTKDKYDLVADLAKALQKSK